MVLIRRRARSILKPTGDFVFPALSVLIVIPNFSRMFLDIWSKKPYLNKISYPSMKNQRNNLVLQILLQNNAKHSPSSGEVGPP